MAVWKGAAYVETDTGGVASTRWWMVSTANSDTTGDQTVWDKTAGQQFTVYYRTGTDGAVPPSAADNVQIEVRDSSGTVLKVLSTGTPPSNGDSFTFDLTSTGNPGGADRHGELELYIQADFDGVAGDYDVDSQNTATVGNITAWARGLIRGNAKVSDLTVSAYPAGSTFAYGTGADEVLTLTATHTQAYVPGGARDIRMDALDGAAVQSSGSAQDMTSTSSTQQFTVNVATFDQASKSYGVRATPLGNAFITPDSGAVLWTVFVDDGVNVTQNGDAVERQSFYTVDPRTRVYDDAVQTNLNQTVVFNDAGYSVANRLFRRTGPTLLTNAVPRIEFYVFNARDEGLTRTINVQVERHTDNADEDNQNIAGTAGRYRLSYTIATTDIAFSRFKKTSPDNPASPPYSASIVDSAVYTGPFPAYPKDVRVTVDTIQTLMADQFGVNSEVIFEDMWTGPSTAALVDVNGVPTEAGSRDQALGAGSLKAKVTTLIDEGSIKVIDLGEHNPKDVAGRSIIVTTDNMWLRRALYNNTESTILDAGSNLTDSQTKLDNSIGYNSNNNSFDTIAAPADSASMTLTHGYADSTAQRNTLLLTAGPVVGFTGDTGNYGYFSQLVAFAALDSTIKLLVIPDVVQSDPTLTHTYKIKIIRLTKDPAEPFVDALADEAPLYSVYGAPAAGAVELIETGSASAIGGEDASNWEFSVTVPTAYDAIKVYATAVVGGARTIGGDVQALQVGYTFDALAFATGIPFK